MASAAFGTPCYDEAHGLRSATTQGSHAVGATARDQATDQALASPRALAPAVPSQFAAAALAERDARRGGVVGAGRAPAGVIELELDDRRREAEGEEVVHLRVVTSLRAVTPTGSHARRATLWLRRPFTHCFHLRLGPRHRVTPMRW